MINKKFIFISLIIIVSLSGLKIWAQNDLDTSISNLSDKIAKHMSDKEKTKIAVIPFQDLEVDNVTVLGRYIAEELTTALFNSGNFNVIERNLLNKVLDELKLSQTGAIDSSSVKELGKITGVDAVVTGSIQDLIDRVAINCRLIETETGSIFAAASEKVAKDKTMEILMGKKEDIKEEKEESRKEEENNMPIVIDSSEYVLESINTMRSKNDRDLLHWLNFKLEFISFILGANFEIKSFFVNPAWAAYAAFNSPQITDEKGNIYQCKDIIGNYKEMRCNEGSCYKIKIPAKGRVPISFVFPKIPSNINKIWFTINNQSIEINLGNLKR
jgi:TolB-like protein